MKLLTLFDHLSIGLVSVLFLVSACQPNTRGLDRSLEIKSLEIRSQNIKETEPVTTEYLIGSYTQNSDHGIYKIRLDHKSGTLTDASLVAATENPSYLAWKDPGHILLAVNQNMSGGVSSFLWNTHIGAFELIDSIQGLGDLPCFIAVSPGSDYFATANYLSNDVHLFALNEQGTFEVKNRVLNAGKGNHPRQEAPHPHWIDWIDWGDHRFIYSVDLGLDTIFKYQIEDNTLTKTGPALTLQSGDGPRHLAFHPSLSRAYLVNELSNTIVALAVDKKTGDMKETQRLSTLKPGFSAHSQAGAIKLSPDAKFVYVSNRGANTIAGFEIDTQGQLNYIGEADVVGDWPRDFHIAQNGQFVIVANQNSNTVNLLLRDPLSGSLTPTKSHLEIHIPTAVIPF